MKIILMDNVRNLGNIGSKVEVNSGYARNYLIPRSKAILATTQNVEIFKKQQDILKSKILKNKIKSESLKKIINNIGNITILVRSGIEGKLFGSVGQKVISESITKSIGFKISKSQIRLPNNNALKFVGVYNVKVHIYGKIFSNISVTILDKSKN